jgi:hypothetical protein
MTFYSSQNLFATPDSTAIGELRFYTRTKQIEKLMFTGNADGLPVSKMSQTVTVYRYLLVPLHSIRY